MTKEIKENVLKWILKTEEILILEAQKYNWNLINRNIAKRTLSRYLTFEREDYWIKIRISDHRSIYKDEHFSLSPNQFDDDLEDILTEFHR